MARTQAYWDDLLRWFSDPATTKAGITLPAPDGRVIELIRGQGAGRNVIFASDNHCLVAYEMERHGRSAFDLWDMLAGSFRVPTYQ